MAVLPATAAAGGMDNDFISQLNKLSTHDLYMKGLEYTEHTPEMPDSAMMCYAIVFDRLEKAHGNKKELNPILHAKIDAAYVVLEFYHDAPMAYQYLTEAREMAHELDNKVALCFIYMNLGFLSVNCKMSSLSALPSDEENLHFTYTYDGYRYAVEAKEWRVALGALMNIAEWTFYEDNPTIDNNLKKCLNLPIPPTHKLYTISRPLTDGLRYYSRQDFLKADSCFQELDKVYMNYPRGGYWVKYLGWFLSARTNERLGNLDVAEKKLKMVYDKVAEIDEYTNRYWSSRMLYRFYERHNRKAEAEHWHLIAFKEKEKLADRIKTTNVKEMKYRSDIAHIQKTLTEEKEASRKTRMILITVGIGLTAIIIILLVWLYYSVKRRRYIMKTYEKHIQLMEHREGEKAPGAATPQRDEAADKGDGDKEPQPEMCDVMLPRILKIINEDKAPLNPDFQLSDLASMLDSNTSYVSRAINLSGKNFKTLLMERRIREACRLLDNPKYNSNFSIEGIAREAGFKSRTTFSVAFKNIVGLTPSEYRKASEKYTAKSRKSGKSDESDESD